MSGNRSLALMSKAEQLHYLATERHQSAVTEQARHYDDEFWGAELRKARAAMVAAAIALIEEGK